MMISEQLPYSPGLVLGEEGGGVNARDMGGVSVRRRDIPYLRFPGAIRALVLQTMGWRPRLAMKKEEARRAVFSEYDSWAKKHSNTANMMGGFLFFRYLQEDKVGPSRFPCGCQQVANRSRLASRSVARLASRESVMAFDRTLDGFDRTAGDHRFDFSRGVCVVCGITRKEFEDEDRPPCAGQPYEQRNQSPDHRPRR